MAKATLNLKRADTFTAKVAFNVQNVMDGYLNVTYPVMSPTQFDEFLKEELTPDEQFDRVVLAVDGMPDADTGEVLEGQAAVTAARNGKFALWTRGALVIHFMEQFGDARVKNSKRSHGR